jgi:hypothetical protein
MKKAGIDKISQKEVREILMLEEYDCSINKFLLHRIVFNYVDGSPSRSMSAVPHWAHATAGHKKTLNFLCGKE